MKITIETKGEDAEGLGAEVMELVRSMYAERIQAKELFVKEEEIS